jgi:hypothetical protein
LLASGAADKLVQRRGELESRLNAIESRDDVAALGSPEERDQWARVQRLEAALAAAPQGDDTAELRERLRLVKGVLYFRLNEAFKARAWQQRRTIKDLDLALREAQSRWVRVDRARKSVPTHTEEFAARVATLKSRIDALQTRLAATEQKQSAYLGQLAVAELQQQKDRLSTYQVQARFALATMYDRAANTDITHTKQGVPPSGGESSPATTGAESGPQESPAPQSTGPASPGASAPPGTPSPEVPAPEAPAPVEPPK